MISDIHSLPPHPCHLPLRSRPKHPLQLWHQWPKVVQAVRSCLDHDHGNAELRKVLLKREVAVDRHKDIELRLSKPEQLSILDPSPTGLGNRDHIMALKVPGQSAVETFIEQDFHEAAGSMRIFASSRKAITCSRVTVGN